MSRLMNIALSLAAALLIAGSTLPAVAAGNDPPKAAPVDPNFTEGRKAIDAKDWAKAIPLFEMVVAKDDKNADAYNWLGYASRNQGNYDQAFAYYGKALAVDSRHRGAHEYIGEAYLKVNNVEKAEEHLKRLDSLCTFGCGEYTELKKKIAEYKASKPS